MAQLPHTLKRIRLNLARSKQFPAGSARHGYEFVAPLDAAGHIDVELWRKHREHCGVRRFWGEFLSAWERYRVEPLRFDDAGDQVAVVVHIVGRTHELDVDETRSSLLTVRDGRVVRVQSFADAEGAREAAGL